MPKGPRILVHALGWCLAVAALAPALAVAQPRTTDPFAPPTADPFNDARGVVTHDPPSLQPGARVRMVVRLAPSVPETATIVLYHRTLGSERRFVERQIPRVDAVQAYLTLPALTHQNIGLQYYILVYDDEGIPIAGIGSRLQPRIAVVPVQERPVASQPPAAAEDTRPPPATPRPVLLPRVFLSLGVGTGIGRARGRAEQTYELYRPGTVGGTYTRTEQSCAVARWAAGGTPLPTRASDLATQLDTIAAVDPTILPASTEELVDAYDSELCNRHQAVAPGSAAAPLHLAPAVGIRLGDRVVLSAFARIQVVTGSRVFGPARAKGLQQSYVEDVTSASPEGERLRPRFTMAGGLKAKYLFAKAGRKITPYLGGFGGIGAARLRVDLNTSQDRNGNSVADDDESAVHGLLDLDGNILPESCVPVWPYNQGCDRANGEADRQRAVAVRSNSGIDDRLIDTVKLGPAFLGILGGAHWQLTRHFGLFGELDFGLWFPGPTTVLADIQVGPVVTF